MNNADLKAENTKLRELLELAIQDIISLNNRPCELCKYRNATWIMPKPCLDCDNPERNTTNWEWQHADKLKELDIETE